jgi:hypothetical protein
VLVVPGGNGGIESTTPSEVLIHAIHLFNTAAGNGKPREAGALVAVPVPQKENSISIAVASSDI